MKKIFLLIVFLIYTFNLNADISNLDTLLQKKVEDEMTSGIVVLVRQNNKIIYHNSFGYMQLYDNGKKLKNPIIMEKDTIFDVASITKIMGTTQAIMKLISEKKISLDDKVVKYFPEFNNNGKDIITIRHLLNHSSGLLGWYPTYTIAKNKKQVKDFIFKQELIYPTGTKVVYSDIGFILLGFIIEEITKQPLDIYLQQNIYLPLGLKNTFFKPNKSLKPKIAATSWGNEFEKYLVSNPNYKPFNKWRSYTIKGEVDDGNAYYALSQIAGHAGLFANAEDLSILGQTLLNYGTYNGVTVYDKTIVEEFIKESIDGRALGFEVNKSYMGEKRNKTTYGHTGFTGMCFAFDQDKNTLVFIMTNKENTGLKENRYTPPTKLCADIMDEVWSDNKLY